MSEVEVRGRSGGGLSSALSSGNHFRKTWRTGQPTWVSWGILGIITHGRRDRMKEVGGRVR